MFAQVESPVNSIGMGPHFQRVGIAIFPVTENPVSQYLAPVFIPSKLSWVGVDANDQNLLQRGALLYCVVFSECGPGQDSAQLVYPGIQIKSRTGLKPIHTHSASKVSPTAALFPLFCNPISAESAQIFSKWLKSHPARLIPRTHPDA